jgi:hypothetical protein
MAQEPTPDIRPGGPSIPPTETSATTTPTPTPFFETQQALRYERQKLIREYEMAYECRLIVLVDAIFPYSVTLFEELLIDVSADQELHLLLGSPGGRRRNRYQTSSRCAFPV